MFLFVLGVIGRDVNSINSSFAGYHLKASLYIMHMIIMLFLSVGREVECQIRSEVMNTHF